MTDLVWLSATELAAGIAAREISPVEVTRAVLDRIETVQASCNAFMAVPAERAMDAARAAEAAVVRGEPLGPLHGVPFTVKDLCNTEGVATTFGSHAFADNVPARDCVAVARLRAAGAVVVAKTTTPEFGHKPMTEAPLFGRTLNPWDVSRTSGGSSGGAGVAAATGCAPLAVGTDGGGSIRIPAACCGIVGMKQTLGLVPHDQTPDLFGLMSYVGPMTRTVADAALMLEAMSGPDASDFHSLGRRVEGLAAAGRGEGSLAGKRVGWRLLFGNERIGHDARASFEAALPVFAELGAELVPLDDEPVEPSYPHWGPLTFSIWATRFAAIEQRLGDRMSSTLRAWMAEGRDQSATAVQAAMEFRTRLFRQVQGWFERVDLIVTPTTTRTALAADYDPLTEIEIDGEPSGGPRDGWYPYTHPFNLIGHPAITVPADPGGDGLPLGLQIVGPWLGDADVLRAAALFEAARPWRERRPVL